MTPEGNAAFETGNTGSDTHKIIMSMVNVEEDRIADSHTYYQRVNNAIQYVNPPINLNVFLLFSVYSRDHKTSMRLLSYVIAFYPVYDTEKYPHMNSKVASDHSFPALIF